MNWQEQIERAISAGDVGYAASAMSGYWQAEPGSRSAGFIRSTAETVGRQRPYHRMRIAFARSCTVEPVVPLFRAACLASGIDPEVLVGGFNTYRQELLDAGSSLYRFSPDVILLMIHTRDIAPELWDRWGTVPPGSAAAIRDRVLKEFESLIRSTRKASSATLIVNTLELPPFPANGELDANIEHTQAGTVSAINDRLRSLARETPGVYVVDYDALVARHGRLTWMDASKWATVRLPIASSNLAHVAQEWARAVQPLTGRIAKVVIVDLDNTLWGGVIGEDGLNGIQLGVEYPGVAFQQIQQALLDLYHRGILLAICSKNNPDDALAALNSHPGMILKPEHFAAIRINWERKSANIAAIAAELNLGIDAMAFLDDNPAERDEVRRERPEVWVIELGADPQSYAMAVQQFPALQRLTFADEDRKRGEMYLTQRMRADASEAAGSTEDFLRGLAQVAYIDIVNDQTMARAAQLTQKTNQFNVCTRRYSEQAIAEMRSDPDWRLLTLRVEDKFADNGIVGVAFLHRDGDTVNVDTFLLSCRVIGRGVETAFLAEIVDEARSARARYVRGDFIPTSKNSPASDFFERHGFSNIKQSDGGSTWILDLAERTVTFPDWITTNAPKRNK